MLSGMFVFGVAVLGKSADFLVEIAVELATRVGIPSLVIGATIVSLGTTLPEIVVSALAAAAGRPGIALGNAIGSVICDTGLIMGLAILMGSIPVKGELIIRQANLQLFFPALLIMLCASSNPSHFWTQGGHLHQFGGLLLVSALLGYLYFSYRWSKVNPNPSEIQEEDHNEASNNPILLVFKLIVAAFFLIISSDILVTCASEVARRFEVPEMVIAQSLVAFGTSLPELVTAITAVRRGHGELALGNVIGADILNILGVVGISTAIQPKGLEVDPQFFTSSFPIMMLILVIFRLGIHHARKQEQIHKAVGFIILTLYFGITMSHWFTGAKG